MKLLTFIFTLRTSESEGVVSNELSGVLPVLFRFCLAPKLKTVSSVPEFERNSESTSMSRAAVLPCVRLRVVCEPSSSCASFSNERRMSSYMSVSLDGCVSEDCSELSQRCRSARRGLRGERCGEANFCLRFCSQYHL